MLNFLFVHYLDHHLTFKVTTNAQYCSFY